jgi:isocitrate dehydrogenase
LKGERTSTNPVATIFAWTGALNKRGELDGLADLSAFAGRLEYACLETLKAGIMTTDLAALAEPGLKVRVADSWEFIAAVAGRI